MFHYVNVVFLGKNIGMLAHEMNWIILIKSQLSSATTCLKLFENCSLEAEEKAQRTFAILPE